MNKNIIILIIALLVAIAIIAIFSYFQKTTKNIIIPTSNTTDKKDSTEVIITPQVDNNASTNALIDNTLSEGEKDISDVSSEEDFKTFQNSDIGL